MNLFNREPQQHTPWNKGKLVGQKPPLKLKEIWAIRVRLQLSNRSRDLALFNLAIDSKLRSCDLVKIRVRDISHGATIASRAMVMQQKTQQAVQFEITEQTRESLSKWISHAVLPFERHLFSSRLHASQHLSRSTACQGSLQKSGTVVFVRRSKGLLQISG